MVTEKEGNGALEGKGEGNVKQKVVNRPAAENSNKIRPEKYSLDLTIRK